jgi:hypothetical protein
METFMKPTHSLYFFIPLTLALLIGCVNPYRTNFNETLDRQPKWIAARLAPSPEKPRLITSDNIRNDNWDLFERGYIMIGYSKFDGPGTDTYNALAQARRIGADVVLLQTKFTKSLTETVAVTQWGPSETTDARQTTNVIGARGNVRTIKTESEVTTSQSPATVYVPQQVDYYEHAATYWRKMSHPIFGAAVQDLNDAQRRQLETNQGLNVRAVVIDSPAFKADLLKGDILLTMNGQPVPSAQNFYEAIAAQAGKKVDFTVLRGDKRMQRAIALNP